MKETNEKPLLSWLPRRPSAALSRRIRQLTCEAEIPTTAKWLWSCVAPTMACALVTLMALNHDEGLPKMPMALILSNQDNAAFAIGGERTGQNHLAEVTFGWTNQGVFQSSISFTPTTNLTN